MLNLEIEADHLAQLELNVSYKEEQLINQDGNGYGYHVQAIVKNGDTNDGIDALVEKYGAESVYNHQGDVWNQFRWEVILVL